MRGMGFDWGDLLSQGIKTAGDVASNVWGSGAVVPGYGGSTLPGTGYQEDSGLDTTDLLTFAAVGVGAFFLIKTIMGANRRTR